jgi:hypothetical protein
MAIDVGANVGTHARLLGDHFEAIIALDSDAVSLDKLYESKKRGESPGNIWPVVGDIVSPTPGAGLAGREFQSWHDRFNGADFAIWMAIIHHLVISRSVPLSRLADLCARLADTHVIEYVDRLDPLVVALAASKNSSDLHDLSRQSFEDAFARHFDIVSVLQVTPSRSLYHFTRR